MFHWFSDQLKQKNSSKTDENILKNTNLIQELYSVLGFMSKPFRKTEMEASQIYSSFQDTDLLKRYG